jgi:hypothetical protein
MVLIVRREIHSFRWTENKGKRDSRKFSNIVTGKDSTARAGQGRGPTGARAGVEEKVF